MRLMSAAFIALLPFAVHAAGSEDPTPPATTQTTTTCEAGTIWDEKTQACVKSESLLLDNDTRYKAARELAYAGRPDQALAVLATMTEGDSDRVLTYKGFANRKAGRVDLGMEYYAQALEQNPDNLLARSYMGQGFVQMGEIAEAARQLDEIRKRGGSGTWAEASLAQAVGTGETVNY